MLAPVFYVHDIACIFPCDDFVQSHAYSFRTCKIYGYDLTILEMTHKYSILPSIPFPWIEELNVTFCDFKRHDL